MEISQNTHDLIIRNGKIIDGSGKKPFFGDIAIDDGKITSVGKIQYLPPDPKLCYWLNRHEAYFCHILFDQTQ